MKTDRILLKFSNGFFVGSAFTIKRDLVHGSINHLGTHLGKLPLKQATCRRRYTKKIAWILCSKCSFFSIQQAASEKIASSPLLVVRNSGWFEEKKHTGPLPRFFVGYRIIAERRRRVSR